MKYRAHLKLKHFKVSLSQEFFPFHADIVPQLKYGNDRNAHEQLHVLEPVENWYNMLFDLPMWIICHLLLRGLFVDVKVSHIRSCQTTYLPQIVKTIEDLEKSEAYELKTDPARQDEPL